MSKKPRSAEVARRGGFTGVEMEALVRKYYEQGTRLREQSTRAGADQSESVCTDVPGPKKASILVYQKEQRRFAKIYKPKALEALLKLRTTKQGTPLGWGIVRKLLAVPDKSLRRKLEIRAAKESWSVRQLDAYIHGRVFKTKRSKGARPLAKPKNMTELLQRLEMHIGESRRRLSHWTESHFLNQTASTKKVSESLRARVLAIRDELKSLARLTKVLSKKLELIATDGPELGKKAPIRAGEAESRKKPR